ncbi:preprotein translocase subunit SecG [Mycoplasmopsis felifaucium]|uniref:Protein-export membrane protein SecG n=1 Tax=Mycoplasmopsis felifaucium TaxID=35768 RepID=A0ABZ2RUX4_9BACT
MTFKILAIVMLIIAFVVVVASLMMSPDSNGFSGALVGSGDLELFKTSKERGSKKILKWVMVCSGIILMILALTFWVLANKQ